MEVKSCEQVSAAWRHELDAELKLVLVALADGCTQEMIAARCGLESERAQEILQGLQDLDLVAFDTAGTTWVREGAAWVSPLGARRRTRPA